MTRRHVDILRFVRGYIEAHGTGPTLREIAAAVGTRSIGNVQQWVTDLVRAGCIHRLPARARAIELLVDVSIPRAPDGAPLYAVRTGGLL
jgi:SOS-response transcriptional repressor LexA